MSNSTRVNVSQQRAAKAFEFAQVGNEKDKYWAYVNRLPMLIRANGIGNAIAFMYSKGKADSKNEWGLLYNQLDEWFYTEHQEIASKQMEALSPKNNQQDESRKPVLMEMVAREQDDFVLRQMTVEALALTNWLKRFVIKKA